MQTLAICRAISTKRRDEALISIKVEPEAQKYFELYKDETKERLFQFYRMYLNSHSFVSAVSKGLKRLRKLFVLCPAFMGDNRPEQMQDIEVRYRRVLKPCERRNADVYIEKDWSLIDESNRKVLDYVFTTCNLRKVFVKKATSKATKFVRKCSKKKSDSFS